MEVAVLLGQHSVVVSIAESPEKELCQKEERAGRCLLGGSVALDGQRVVQVGDFALADSITVQLENKVWTPL